MAPGNNPDQSPQELLQLATTRFGQLSEAEAKLLRAAPRGDFAVCGPSGDFEDPANDPSKADQWGPEREVRSGLIRWLCTDREAASRVDPAGIRLLGAKISGTLDLSFATVPFSLSLCRCRLGDQVLLKSTQIPALYLNGSRTGPIRADGATVAGDVFLREGFTAEGEVRLLRAHIARDLDCSGGTFKNPPRKDVASSGDALIADGVTVGGAVFLRAGFAAEGEVRLLGGQIGGDLDCSDGTFRNPPRKDLSQSGKALNAVVVGVSGRVCLCSGFTAEGEVRLLGAKIGGDLDCSGGTFRNPPQEQLPDSGCALIANRIDVRGTVFLGERSTAEGEVQLVGAEIGGDLDCIGGKLSVFNAQGAKIGHHLFLRDVLDAKNATIDLRNASTDALIDDEASWPAEGKLYLDGFVYGRISQGPTDAETRLKWLALQPKFKPQPYRQLAKVLREAGHARGARRVLYELERRRRKAEDRSLFSRLISWAFKTTLGYGYYPQRVAVVGLVLLILMGWWLFRQGYFAGAVVPTDRDAYYCFRTHGRPPDHYQRFTASIYSLENSVPLFNLGQKDLWTPDPTPRGSRRWSDFLRRFRWGQIVFGWFFSTLFVAGVTGVVRKE